MIATRRLSQVRKTAIATVLLLTVSLLCGCQDDNWLETEYGRTDTMYGHESVNGLSVFMEMFEAAGHETATATSLTPRAQTLADVIVWAPRDFKPPAADAVEWMEDWLNAKPNRTLIYVHRDYDAAISYWNEVSPSVAPNLLPVVQPQMNSAQSNFTGDRVALPTTGTADYTWFAASGANKPRTITTLQGDPQWTSAIDPAKLEIELIGDVQPIATGRTVLASGSGEPLIIEEWHRNSKVLVLANGSFVLNYPLINHEHRKLAGKLVDAVGDDQYVVFLQASSSPTVLDEDPTTSLPTPYDFLAVEPINYVLLHLILFGLILCFARYPIFGIPRDDAPDNLSDFGEHLEALGKLLAKTGNRMYAVERLHAYRKLVRGDHASSRNLSYSAEDPSAARQTLESSQTQSQTLTTASEATSLETGTGTSQNPLVTLADSGNANPDSPENKHSAE